MEDKKKWKNIIRKRYNTFDIKFFKETSNNVKDEIIEVFKNTQFNKISIPVASFKNIVNPEDTDDNKNLTVGFVKSFNPETNKFKVVIFNKFKEAINNLEDSAIEITYTEKTDKSGNVSLGTIIKLNIIAI